jgi:hypothetical protein
MDKTERKREEERERERRKKKKWTSDAARSIHRSLFSFSRYDKDLMLKKKLLIWFSVSSF